MKKLSALSSQLSASSGFTLIEVTTAIVLIAIIMIPIVLMAQEYVRSVRYGDLQTMTANLARQEMGIVNNLSYPDPTLTDGYNNIAENYSGYPYDLNRSVAYVPGTDNNLKMVRVRVYPNGSTEKLIELATYVMSVQFGGGAGGGTPADESLSFIAYTNTGNWFQGKILRNVKVENISADIDITMTGALIKSSITNTVTAVKMDAVTRFIGSIQLIAGQETQVNFQTNFVMTKLTPYSGANGGEFTFTAQGNPSDTLTFIFLFSDGSKSASYTWNY